MKPYQMQDRATGVTSEGRIRNSWKNTEKGRLLILSGKVPTV